MPICPRCDSYHMKKYDTYKYNGITKRRYHCAQCKYTTAYPFWQDSKAKHRNLTWLRHKNRPRKLYEVDSGLGFPVDSNIKPLVLYLNANGITTSCSCGHEGTVDLYTPNAALARLAMYRLPIPKRCWTIRDYKDGDPPSMWPDTEHRYVLWILGAKPHTADMWKLVRAIGKVCTNQIKSR